MKNKCQHEVNILGMGLKTSSVVAVWERQCFEDIFPKDHSIDESINRSISNKGVCRLSPDTPDLLNII